MPDGSDPGGEPEAWTPLSESRVYDGYVRVRTDRYRLPDGGESDWDVIEIPDTVTVIAVTRDDRVVLFDQYRVGPRRVLGELPGGLIDPGEDAVAAGIRELREETGYLPAATFDAGAEWAAANVTRRRHTIVAAGCELVGEPEWGEHEHGRVRTIAAADLMRHLATGEISDGGTALRALHVFVRATLDDDLLRALQQRVRSLLAAPGPLESPSPDAIDRFWRDAATLRPADLRPALDQALAPLPADDPVALYERASLHDYLGEEAAAVPLYRAALAAGLSGERVAAARIQLASSLRNVGDPSGAIAVLKDFPPDEPLAPAAQAFLALALLDDGKPAPALRTALHALAPTLPAYGRAVSSYADEVRAPRRIRAISVALVVKDGHVLAEEYPATARHDAFLRAPGGGIEVGETAVAAMRRELREELGVEAEEVRRVAVTENIFERAGMSGHEIVSVFAVRSAALDALPLDAHLPVLDGDTRVGWHRLDGLDRDLPFYPAEAGGLARAVADGSL